MKNTLNFLITIIITFAITFAILFVTGFLPDELKQEARASTPNVTLTTNTPNSQNTVSWVTEVDPTAEPVRIVIQKIGVNASIASPNTLDADVLDSELLKGAVHYPGSGTLKETSNIFIFGHSTSHEVVQNQAYKTFNRLNELNIGDEIRIDSTTDEYVYKVSAVSKVDANEALVTFSNKKKMLTLSTCDSFGTKSDRFVVQAEFVKSAALNKS